MQRQMSSGGGWWVTAAETAIWSLIYNGTWMYRKSVTFNKTIWMINVKDVYSMEWQYTYTHLVKMSGFTLGSQVVFNIMQMIITCTWMLWNVSISLSSTEFLETPHGAVAPRLKNNDLEHFTVKVFTVLFAHWFSATWILDHPTL